MFSLDISNHKAGISIEELVKEGLVHLYMKATEYTNFLDKYMEDFYSEAARLKVPCGFYHFARPNDPEGQAEYFYNAVKDKPCQLRYCLDMEVDMDNISDFTRRFCNKFESLMGKSNIMCIYASAYYARDNFSQDIKDKYPLWVANYNSTQNVDTGWKDIAGWQYSESEIHQGQECDANIFYPSIVIPGGTQVVETTKIIPEGNQKVRELQTICCQYGFNITIDGLWGPETEEAVHKLPLCGLPYTTPVLTKWVQLRLGLDTDGVFGSKSYEATIEFQRIHGLYQDGIVGFNTLKEMALC
ncbi:MAG: GH25 family lysozyme [Bacilli bacterium]